MLQTVILPFNVRFRCQWQPGFQCWDDISVFLLCYIVLLFRKSPQRACLVGICSFYLMFWLRLSCSSVKLQNKSWASARHNHQQSWFVCYIRHRLPPKITGTFSIQQTAAYMIYFSWINCAAYSLLGFTHPVVCYQPKSRELSVFMSRNYGVVIWCKHMLYFVCVCEASINVLYLVLPLFSPK